MTLQIANDCKLLDIISALLVSEGEFSSGVVRALTRGKDKMLSSSTASGGMFKLPQAKKMKVRLSYLLHFVTYFTANSGPAMMAVIPLKMRIFRLVVCPMLRFHNIVSLWLHCTKCTKSFWSDKNQIEHVQ